jgi:hypothetical protein
MNWKSLVSDDRAEAPALLGEQFMPIHPLAGQSFRDQAHLETIVEEAQQIVSRTLAPS